MADAPLLARRQIRLAVVRALEDAQVAKTILSPGDWPSQTEKMPAVLVRAVRSTKEQLHPGQANFTSVIVIELESRVASTSAAKVQDELEALDARIEVALLTDYRLMSLVQRIHIETESTFTAEGRLHADGTRWQVSCQLVEEFVPVYREQPLEGMDVHIDLVNRFDAVGTYDTPFPDVVAPAPRDAGPDGRDEARLSIDFNT